MFGRKRVLSFDRLLVSLAATAILSLSRPPLLVPWHSDSTVRWRRRACSVSPYATKILPAYRFVLCLDRCPAFSASLALSLKLLVLSRRLQCFEGMKAYRDAEGNVRLFRPELNIRRFNKSLARLRFPVVDETAIIELIR